MFKKNKKGAWNFDNSNHFATYFAAQRSFRHLCIRAGRFLCIYFSMSFSQKWHFLVLLFPNHQHIQKIRLLSTLRFTTTSSWAVQKVQAVVCCPRILNSRAPAISWGYSPYLLKNSCGVQSTTEKIEKSTARAELPSTPRRSRGGSFPPDCQTWYNRHVEQGECVIR